MLMPHPSSALKYKLRLVECVQTKNVPSNNTMFVRMFIEWNGCLSLSNHTCLWVCAVRACICVGLGIMCIVHVQFTTVMTL